jgi:sugar phosphate isomerase/epimerase
MPPMIPCISQVTTLSTLFEFDIPAYANAGWSAFEIWLTKLESFVEGHGIAEAKSLLLDHGMKAAGASLQGGLLLSQGEVRSAHWSHFARRLEILAELDVPILIVAADLATEPAADDYQRASEALARAAEAARPFGVRLALEFQKSARFCASLDTTLALIAQSGAEGVGVCLDLFHYYTGPSKFEDLAYLSCANLAWVQVCDLSGTPRELARDADRILPGEGDFQIEPILEHLARIGYDGYVSLELQNPQLWQVPPGAVADAAHRAMVRTLGRFTSAGAVSAGGF